MKKLLIPPVSLGLAVGCGGDMPTDTEGLTPNLGVAGNSGCYTVKFATEASGVPPILMGSITGDLEGTVEYDLTVIIPTGTVAHVSGNGTFSVAGGIVDELIGGGFQDVFTNIAVIPPPDPAHQQLHGKSKIVSGADHGNLTFHGVFDAGVFPFEVQFDYQGVICP